MARHPLWSGRGAESAWRPLVTPRRRRLPRQRLRAGHAVSWTRDLRIRSSPPRRGAARGLPRHCARRQQNVDAAAPPIVTYVKLLPAVQMATGRTRGRPRGSSGWLGTTTCRGAPASERTSARFASTAPASHRPPASPGSSSTKMPIRSNALGSASADRRRLPLPCPAAEPGRARLRRKYLRRVAASELAGGLTL